MSEENNVPNVPEGSDEFTKKLFSPENMKINFSFEDQKYEVPARLKEFFYIQLPDQRILEVQGWMEVFPPFPRGFKVVESNNGQPMETAILKSNKIEITDEMISAAKNISSDTVKGATVDELESFSKSFKNKF